MKHAIASGPRALRREALITECALQRLSLAAEAKNLLAPLAPRNLRAQLGPRLKIPLMIAGGALGLAVTRPKRAMPLLLSAASAWKSVNTVLPLARRLAGRFKK